MGSLQGALGSGGLLCSPSPGRGVGCPPGWARGERKGATQKRGARRRATPPPPWLGEQPESTAPRGAPEVGTARGCGELDQHLGCAGVGLPSWFPWGGARGAAGAAGGGGVRVTGLQVPRVELEAGGRPAGLCSGFTLSKHCFVSFCCTLKIMCVCVFSWMILKLLFSAVWLGCS